MTIDELIKQSTNSNPAERKKAIVALANTGDPRGLDQLAIIAASDSDATLRELASRAQRYMSEKLGGSPASSASSSYSSTSPAASSSSYGDSYSDAYTTNSSPSSDFTPSTGRAYVNNAMGSHANGDDYGAKMWLAQALQSDPSLAKDHDVRALAATVTGLSSDQAMAQLGTAPPEKKKRAGAGTSNDSCLTLIIEMALLFAAVAGTTLLTLTLVRNNPASLTPVSTSGSASLRDSLSQFQSLAPTMFLVIAGILGVVSVIFSLVWYTLLHTFSTMALGGNGSWDAFLHALLRVAIVTTALGAIPILLTFGALNQPIGSRSAMLNVANSLSSLIGLGSVIAQIYFVSKIQQFDYLRGCVAVVLTPIIFGCGCVALIYMAGMSNALTR
jgi:hypothetical protein